MNDKTDEHGLNPRQRKFVSAYVSGKPATQAYIAAGYSPNGADVAGPRLLGNVRIQAAVKAARKQLSDAARWEKWQLLDYYQRVLETPVGEVDENDILAQEVTREEAGEMLVRTKVKMVDKLASARELAKLLGWYEPEEVVHNHVVSVVIGGDA